MATDHSKKIEKIFSRLGSIVDGYTARQTQQKRPDTLEEAENDVKQLEVVLNELIAAQHAANPTDFLTEAKLTTPEVRKEKFAKFTTWMKQHAPESQIEETWCVDHTVAEGSGIVAVRDIEEEEMIMSIPREAMMTFETALTSPLGSLVSQYQMFDSQRSLTLSLHLFLERVNPNSKWTPYIDILPTEFYSPFSVPLSELEPLRCSSEFYTILTTFKAIVRQYYTSYSLFRKHQSTLGLTIPTYKQFLWACLTIMARQNFVPSKDAFESPQSANSNVLALIPGFDCFNHIDMVGEITTYFVPSTDSSETLAPRSVKKGEQIYIIYGDRPNSKLFTYQGFIVPDLSTDVVRIPFGTTSSSTTKSVTTTTTQTKSPFLPSGPVVKNKKAAVKPKLKEKSKEEKLEDARHDLLQRLALFHSEIQLPLKTTYKEWDQMPPPFAPLTNFKDAWKPAYIRTLTATEVAETSTKMQGIIATLGCRFVGDALMKTKILQTQAVEKGNSYIIPHILLEQECPSHILPRVLPIFITTIEDALLKYKNVGDEDVHDNDSVVTLLCRKLVFEEKKLLTRELAKYKAMFEDIKA